MKENTKEHTAFKVSGAISSHMVVQRDRAIRVWGTAAAGEKIFGEFMGEKQSAAADETGNWILEFSPQSAASKAQRMKIYGQDGGSVEFQDILVGDVYFITGQSNAEMNLRDCIAAAPEDKNDIPSATTRLFTQTREFVFAHPDLWAAPQEDIVNSEWGWRKTTDESAYEFSALGYYFGKELRKTVKDVPLGLIMAAAGGAQIAELLPAELARRQGYTTSAAVGPAGYYNTLIHPFLKMPIRAMLFYQGESESNPQNCGQYGSDLEAFVNGLRVRWGIDFKFYNVQLASHGKISYEYWPSIGELRAAQYQAGERIADYYLAVAMDCGFREGDPDFAHPLYKKVPGQRLAKLVLAAEYGLLNMEYAASPCICSAEWEEDSVTLTFRHVGDGLRTLDGTDAVIGFQIERNGQREDASAQITAKNKVRIFCGKHADAVCYGMQQTAEPTVANLANSALLPAPAFRQMK